MRKIVSFFGWCTIVATFVLLLIVVFSLGKDSSPGTDNEKALASGRAVGIVPLTGEIVSADKFRDTLHDFVDDDRVKAIVVQIDSPGGAVGASEEISSLIRSADLKKPVVASLGNMAASGGFYAAVACRKIVTLAGTLTGSIGVIFMVPNVSDIISRVGFNMLVVKSGALKDAGSPFRKPTPEDLTQLQHIVDTAYGQFVRAVSEGRKKSVDEVKKVADGRVILGEEAVQLGLADEIGSLQRAGEVALQLANVSGEPELAFPKKKSALASWFEETAQSLPFASWGRSHREGMFFLLWP